MIHALAKLKVESYETWKPFFDKRASTREEAGSKEAHLFLNSDNPNEVVILFKWDNKENAQKYMESDNIRKYLKNAGAEIIDITYLDEKETSI
ncbi:MAG: putative quinol monooxygenase [Methanobacterium sp.]